MSIAEIAKIMDCPENTVKSRLRYARQTLKAGIEKEQHRGTLLFSSMLGAMLLIPLGMR